MDLITDMRKEIDKIDKEIMEKLEKRFDLAIEIGNAKAKEKKQILDTNREEVILKRASKFSHSPQIEVIYNTIMEESKKLQRK